MGKFFLRFLKDWTLPVAIVVGTAGYLTFSRVEVLADAGDVLSPVFDALLPILVFLTLLLTFCRVDFGQMVPHRWQAGVLAAQLVLVAAVGGIALWMQEGSGQRLLWESLLTCVIGPSAAAAPVVVGKLGGNVSTMTAFTLMSAVVSALLIPAVFPLLEPAEGMAFGAAFLLILWRVSAVLLLPLALGWVAQRCAKGVCEWVACHGDVGFYCWCAALSFTTGITVRNIMGSGASGELLLMIGVLSLLLCIVQFLVGRAVGRCLGDEVNGGQALFQKNTALSIWVAYMFLNPVSSIGAGCYVLWQNVINSVELWQHRREMRGRRKAE